LATVITRQVLSFIQDKIAETHSAGGDIVDLLENPEIAFSLQVLDGNYSKTEQAPEDKAAEQNNNTGTEQLITTAGKNTNDS
jgi:hypothetical protein